MAIYLNQIRKRAYGPNWNEATYGYTNADFKTNELAILKEKDKEFVNEGRRWFDICRMKDGKNGKPLAFSAEAGYKGTSAVLKESESHKLLWPIDVSTMNADDLLEQTPGY